MESHAALRSWILHFGFLGCLWILHVGNGVYLHYLCQGGEGGSRINHPGAIGLGHGQYPHKDNWGPALGTNGVLEALVWTNYVEF